MTADYSFYIFSAYGICFLVLSAVTLSTLAAWRKVKGMPDKS